MTAQQLRVLVVKTAMHFLGRKEADGSHREIIDIYNSISPLPNGFRMKYTDPWCAAFVSAIAWVCKLVSIIFPSASCPDMVSKYKAAGRWMETDSYMPQIGDVVFYDWDDSGQGDDVGTPDHVGIVSEVFASSFNVIEGNASDMVKIRTLQRNGRYIRGFGLPDYAAAATGDEVIVEPEPAPEDPMSDPNTYALTYTILRHGAGMKGQEYLREQVRSVQQRLRWLGFDIGPDGADGEYGDNTAKAVGQYQKSVGLLADKEFGPKTRGRMDGLEE